MLLETGVFRPEELGVTSLLLRPSMERFLPLTPPRSSLRRLGPSETGSLSDDVFVTPPLSLEGSNFCR